MTGRRLPVWALGLTNMLFGMYGGVLVITVPQLLSERGMAESSIAAITAAAISPGFWTFLFCPVLDVRFSRRTYSVITALVSAVLLWCALLNLEQPAVVTVLLVTGFFFANLYQSALGGWLSGVITAGEAKALSVSITIANISGGGLMAVLAGSLVHALPLDAAAALLSLAILIPIVLFLWIPVPEIERRRATESFRKFFGEVRTTLGRREVLLAALMFVAPAATFSLVNIIAGFGPDFKASPEFVARIGGVGVAVAGIAGSLLFPLVSRRLPLRFLYLAIGAAGSLFTLALITLPRSPSSFAIALIGENVFQSLAITASTAITFDTVGRDNPLASTTYCLMVSAFNVANTYMLLADGWGYGWQGVSGSYLIDALATLGASVLLTILFWTGHARQRQARARTLAKPPAIP